MLEPSPNFIDTDPGITGHAWSAIAAASAGCAALGGLTVLTEVSVRISHMLTFLHPVGDLSGVTILSILIWLLTWILLHRRWKTRSIRYAGLVLAFSLILILVGLVGTFPPVADWFHGK